MRRLVVTTLMSLDGVVGAPEKLLPFWDGENKQYAVEELGACDAFLFGRVTFDTFAARWPSVRGDAFADVLNTLPKYVASRTLGLTTWAGSEVLGQDVASEVRALKARPGKEIVKYGVGDLDRTLLAHGLVDELRVSVVPVVIGAGRRLFEGLEVPPRLRLVREKRFENGIVRLGYELESAEGSR